MMEKMDCYPLWINWEKRVISFHAADGFQKLEYATHEEMFSYAIKKGFEGFGIQ